MRLPPRQPPDFVVKNHGTVYLNRWYLTPWSEWRARGKKPTLTQRLWASLPSVYLHQFLSSDEDRALHDHPWFNISFLLKGSYVEETIAAGGIHYRKIRHAWTLSGVKFRSPWTAHRVELIEGRPCWSLFITGPVVRTWGFHCPQGWRRWTEFVSRSDNSNDIGPGCAGLQ